MKYAVIYYSQTGNTKKLAENIYSALPDTDKTIINADNLSDIPIADVYFIGFLVQRLSCNARIYDILRKIDNAKILLFATCGLNPNPHYKRHIQKKAEMGINESCYCYGFYLCQGAADDKFKRMIYNELPDSAEMLNDVFTKGDTHPDDTDLTGISDFTELIISSYEE
jgi:flavodoxin